MYKKPLWEILVSYAPSNQVNICLHCPGVQRQEHILEDLPSNLARLSITALGNEYRLENVFLLGTKKLIALRFGKVGEN